ncbi:MAG: YebC/PmpR family DNA-binding transcriptional regulator [Bacteroidota bacterium]|jgi:YebC/PmpR family DNA-binding regulatory protein
MGRAFEYRKARMFKRWGNMARVFTRLGREITMAVKTSGPDPANNSKLRLLLQTAKSENMPKDTIDRAIKRATEKDTKDYKEHVYEGYAAHGIAILIESATDNTTRTVANVRSYFNKHNGSLGTNGMLDFIFERKCSFTVMMKPDLDLEELELELIDFNVDEVFEDGEELMIYADFQSFGPIQKYLEENSFEIKSFRFERIPNDTKELNEEQREEVFKLIEKIEEDDDVTNVFHNIKL